METGVRIDPKMFPIREFDAFEKWDGKLVEGPYYDAMVTVLMQSAFFMVK